MIANVLCLLFPAVAYAYDFEVDGIYYNRTSATTVAVTYKNEPSDEIPDNTYVGTVVIPARVIYDASDYSVTAIDNYAFYRNQDLTSVIIPNTVTIIASKAFGECIGLTSIELPESITDMEYAFSGCTGLTSIELPNSITDMVNAFRDCTGLTSIKIPSNITSLANAFSGCTGLTSIDIPNSVTDIEWAFANCTALTSIELPNSITDISTHAFFRCSALENISIGSNVQKIDRYAFSGCTGLRKFYSNAEVPPVCEEGVFERLNKRRCVLYVPAGSVDDYAAAEEWKEFPKINEVSALGEVAADANSMERVYDLQGRPVSNAGKGLYIVNGSKVLRK